MADLARVVSTEDPSAQLLCPNPMSPAISARMLQSKALHGSERAVSTHSLLLHHGRASSTVGKKNWK